MPPADLEPHIFRHGGDCDDPLHCLRLRYRPVGNNADMLCSALAPLRFDASIILRPAAVSKSTL